jgi:hypothetical protein
MTHAARSLTALALAAALGLALAPAARADDPPLPNLPRPGERGKSAPTNQGAHPTPILSTEARVPWPRLDPGAIVCRTRDDLRLQADVIRARSDGTPYVGAAPNCRVLGSPVAIDILNRESPAATEVKLRDPPGGAGWTDTWLPNQKPR